MTYEYKIADILFVDKYLKKGFRQKDVNALFHAHRRSVGTATERGDYTNFISKVSRTSKHRAKLLQTVYERELSGNVIQKIMEYLKCDKKTAKLVYTRRIKPLCVTGFETPSATGLQSIRYYALAANSELYILFTTENYAEAMGLDETTPHDDIWTVKTAITWGEVVDGRAGMDDIMFELEMATGDFLPILLNVCIQKA